MTHIIHALFMGCPVNCFDEYETGLSMSYHLFLGRQSLVSMRVEFCIALPSSLS
jgi:hypothetical protein